MRSALRDLYEEYLVSLSLVRRAIRRARAGGALADLGKLAGMERDARWAMEYMATGWPPPESQGPYRRVVPVDPQRLLAWRSSPPASPSLPVERVRLQILAALDLLSPQEREAFLMVVGEGLSYGEAAELLGVKRRTAQCYVERARVKIASRRAVQAAHKVEGAAPGAGPPHPQPGPGPARRDIAPGGGATLDCPERAGLSRLNARRR